MEHLLRDPHDGRVKRIEYFLLNAIATSAPRHRRVGLFDNHDAVRFRNRFQNRVEIEQRSAQIEHRAYLFVILECFRSSERERNGLGITNNRDVATFALNSASQRMSSSNLPAHHSFRAKVPIQD